MGRQGNAVTETPPGGSERRSAERSPARRLFLPLLAGAVFVLVFLASAAALLTPQAAAPAALRIPRLSAPPKIDGDLSDWKEAAFHDGVWDIHRLLAAPWFDPARNRLTDHGGEPSPGEDLTARYYLAWDEKYLYFGADVVDNVSDVEDPAAEPKRWYDKDSVSFFIEAPRDDIAETFGRGDNAFCFVADPAKPADGAWWRHGDATRTYIEEPLPKEAVEYVVRPVPKGASRGDFVLEARVAMTMTLGKSDPDWKPVPQPGHVFPDEGDRKCLPVCPQPGHLFPDEGDRLGLMIVHCDPDGGGYGGHLLIYGRDDNDASWSPVELTEAKPPIDRKSK